jgi:hypothetical protein
MGTVEEKKCLINYIATNKKLYTPALQIFMEMNRNHMTIGSEPIGKPVGITIIFNIQLYE